MAQAFSQGAAAKNTMSPSAMASFAVNSAFSASVKNFTIGDFHSPPSTLMKARPFAPSDFAISSRLLISPCVRSARPWALIALITPPPATVDWKTLKAEFRKVSEKSTSSIAKRTSGLSTP